ncbi:hypothetical protein H2203_008315 [Taxawa tesnikishii (nom. ined.)]|nr:hypothetical protein H2203_008315 [Dothideales sp. JES 119]
MGAPTPEEQPTVGEVIDRKEAIDHLGHLDADSTIPEEQDPLVIMSDDAGQVYAPPAHLAARFYRNSASSRRKSSAASSRRNSLSSTHSHGSSRSGRQHSNHIAQHLRRASIIESRKARLADRAAHAEQVRLRAALAKATPSTSTRSSEERALAAQIAREKYLAKVAAQCAEEVQRAKQKAQEMKQRREEEEQKARTEMEERLAEADKRRAKYQRNLYTRRTRRASSTEKKLPVVAEDVDTEPDSAPDADMQSLDTVLNDETAARRIQKAWRIKQRKTIVDAYMDLDLTFDRSRDITFEEMGALVSDPPVIEATSRLLKLLDLQDRSAPPTDASTRTFLSAYLIVTHPTAVLSKNGAQEQDLVSKAREFVVLFESVVSWLAPWNGYNPLPIRLEGLAQAHTTYTAAFDAWRTQDSSALVEAMVAQFVELDAIWQTVKDDTRGEVASDYREGIRDNQVVLLSKIRKLAGPDRADFLIKKAIRESRRKRVKRRSPAEVRPRVAEGESAPATSDAAGPLSAAASGLSEEPSQPQDGSHQTQSFSRFFSPIPSNRIITHELAIDKDYRISASSGRDALNREICDNMRIAFEKGEGTLWTVAMAENIRGKLLHILKPGNALYESISEVLDTDHVYRQASEGVFSYEKFFSWIAAILPKLCAPFRDEEVNKLAHDLQNVSGDVGEMIEMLFRLLHVIDLLSLDYSNFLLMNAAPVLIRESAGYEQRMFAQDLQSGAITLQKTKRWWRNASVNMLTEADRRDPEHIRDPADRPSAQRSTPEA